MKLKHKDLQNLYEFHIFSSISIQKKGCPPIKKLALCILKSKLSKKQKIKIIDHITGCPFCIKEFKLILQILRYEKKLSKEICNTIYEFINTSKLLKQPKKSYSPKKSSIHFFKWEYISLIMGTVIIILIINLFYNSPRKESRGIDYLQIQLIEPVNKKLSKSSLIFKWKELKGSEFYIIEIFDKTLSPIWKSKKVYSNYSIPPKEIIVKLSENKTYFWMITVFFTDGRKLESNLAEFIIAK